MFTTFQNTGGAEWTRLFQAGPGPSHIEPSELDSVRVSQWLKSSNSRL
jgi:hypothetical protein